MLNSIKVRIAQGSQYIPDPRQASPAGLRGKPVIGAADCASGCDACVSVCPTQAITLAPLQIDLARCVLCGECAPVCPGRKLSFTNDFRIACTTREGLLLSESRPTPDPVQVSAALHKRFGRSLKLRSVSAGGCNGCELEVNAGPITRNMTAALQLCWDAMPEPKLVIAVGACAISGGLFADSDSIDRDFLDRFKPSLYLPGCPTHPLTIVCGILDLLGIAS